MAIMHESFFTFSKHFSAHRPLIQHLFRSSPVFQETCTPSIRAKVPSENDSYNFF
jgi:hypothetical protein